MKNALHTVADLLTGPGDLDRTIAVRGGMPISLAQLRQDVAGNSIRLSNIGCKRGLLVTEDTYWAIVGMLALFQCGAEVLLPQNTTPGACATIREHWDVLVCDRLPPGHLSGFILEVGGQAITSLQPLDSSQCRLILFTTGSTGAPKRAAKSLAVMEREAAAIEQIVGNNVADKARVFGTVTHQHLFGLSYKLFWPLCSGRIVDGTVHELWESLLTQNLRNAVIVTSPAHLTRLGAIDRLPADARPDCVFSAGAALPLSASAVAAKVFGTPICEIYGSTETGTIAWRPRDQIDLPWQAAPGVAIDVAVDGALCLTSPFLMEGEPYHGDDLIERDSSGGFHLRGRTDRIVKIEGKRVSLSEVERQIGESPLVAHAMVLALPGDAPTLAAAVVPSELGQKVLTDAGPFRFGRLLRHALDNRQEAAGKPRRWRFVEALPTGTMGKVTQRDLISLFNQTRPTEPELREARRDGDAVELALYNSPDMQQLDGHFPGMPIVPGVAQVDWAVKFAARHFDLPLEVARAYQVKFHRLTLPGTMVTLRLVHAPEKQRLSFSYHQGEVVLTSGIIRIPTP